MTTLKTAGFIIANDEAIISTGTTLADAIAAYNRDVGGILITLEDGTRDYAPMTEDNLGGHLARPATAALLAHVDDVGGAISWEVVDGVACTCDEADSLEKDDSGFVTDGTHFLVQLPAKNQWGFVLADDDQTFPGGFGSGMTSWRQVALWEVPAEVRERLGWLLSETDGNLENVEVEE